MSHTIREKAKLLARVRRIRGQVEGLERALEAERGCADIVHQITALRGAMNGLMAGVIEDHIRTHVADSSHSASDAQPPAVNELIEVVNSYLR